MTNQEFSNEFDILYNNIMSNQAPGLDEYEKSVFLTKAQDEIVKSYFNPKLNKVQEGFDNSERRQIDFSTITKFKKYEREEISEFGIIDNRRNTVSITLPDNIMMFLNEFVEVIRGPKSLLNLVVKPINYKEYSRLMSKPFKRPIKFEAWRLITSDTSNQIELIVGPNDTVESYTVRYIKKPQAIILTNLEDVTLDGKYEEQSCELDPILHHEILQRAVELAKAAYTGDLQSQIALGVNSETPMGIVQPSR